MISVFLDSNILYNDPLMNKSTNELLLKKVNHAGGKIYISDIVVREVKNNYRKQLLEVNHSVEKIINDCKKMMYNSGMKPIDVDKQILEIDKKYDEYIKENRIEILKIDGSLLEEVVNRSILRVKPFSENKQEFRDCLIWLTYAKFVEQNSLENCYFITKNTTDFCDTSDKKQFKLHPDILKDTNKILFHKDVYQFLINESEILDKFIFQKVREETLFIDKDKIKEDLKDYVIEEFKDEIEFYIEDLSGKELSKEYQYNIDYATFENIEYNELIDLRSEANIDDDAIYYYGRAIVNVKVALRQDLIEDDYLLAEPVWIVQVDFSMKKELVVNKDYQPSKDIQKSNFDENYTNINVINFSVIDMDYCCIEEIREFDRSMAEADMMDTLEEYHRHH